MHFFLKGKRKEEELIQCIKFTGVIMTFLSLPYKRACFLVMWQKSAQVIYNTVVWIKALIWIETDVLSIKDTSLKQRNVSDQWNLVVTNVSLSLFTWWSQTFRIFCTASAAFCLCRVVVCVCVQRMFVTRWNSAQTYKHQEHRTSNMKTSNWLSCQIQPSKRNFTVCVQPIFRCCPNFIFKNGHWTSLYHKAIFQPCEKMNRVH